MIQLWADAFMMYEDDYPFFMSTYRLLRKEAVEFPSRETSDRFTFLSMGLKSPIFDYLEEVSYKSKPKKLLDIENEKSGFDKIKAIEKANEELINFTGGPIELVGKGLNDENLAMVFLNPEDIESIKNYMKIIDDICASSEVISDIKTELGVQAYRYCQA